MGCGFLIAHGSFFGANGADHGPMRPRRPYKGPPWSPIWVPWGCPTHCCRRPPGWRPRWTAVLMVELCSSGPGRLSLVIVLRPLVDLLQNSSPPSPPPLFSTTVLSGWTVFGRTEAVSAVGKRRIGQDEGKARPRSEMRQTEAWGT